MSINQYADIILTSNAIFTGKESKPFKGSVAIKGKTILGVGSKEEINHYIGNKTKEYVYGDQLIMPGFNDFHIHLFLGSLSQDSVSLRTSKSEEEAAKLVKEFADSRPDAPWIFGFDWYHTFWEKKVLPHRKTLDQLIPDRPVFLLNAECHGAWVNTKALEIMNINKQTENPPYGKITKDEDGEPTGFLYETAMKFAEIAFKEMPEKHQEYLLEKFQQYAAKNGVTSVSDMFPMPGLEVDKLDLYKKFEDAGKLTTRIHFLITLDGNINRATSLREKYNTSMLQFSGFKQFLDGVPATYTAYLVDEYSDKNTVGDTLMPPDHVMDLVNEAHKERFRVRLHACGDGAVRLGLDSIEAAIQNSGTWDSRHTIEHIEVIHPDDINRFKELGVIASMQPEHMASDEFSNHTYIERLGQEREPYMWPIKTLTDSGAKMAFGSDFPVVDIDPFTEIYRAVTRLHNDGEPKGGWNPQEKITLAEALKHYTLGSSYGVFREDELGSLESGKLADIIVLDRNLFNVDSEQIRETHVELTVVDGKVVYEKQ